MIRQKKLKTPFWIKRSFFTSFSISYNVFIFFSIVFFLAGSIFYIYVQSLSSVKSFENEKLMDKKQELEKKIEQADSEIALLSKSSRISTFLAFHPEFVRVNEDPIYLPEDKN